jgi:hypothetical protein
MSNIDWAANRDSPVLDNAYARIQQKAGKLDESLGKFVRPVVFLVCFDLVNSDIQFAVNIKYCVRRLKFDLDGCLLGIKGHALFDCHYKFYAVAGVNALAGDEAVYTWEYCGCADVCRNKKVQHTQAGIAFGTLGAEPAVDFRDLYLVGKKVAGVVACSITNG